MTSSTPESPLLDRLRAATAGEYEIVRELGRGGFATVYLARDLELERDVAIKVLTVVAREDDPANTGEVERFRREARTAGRLSHPNIIPIYAVKATNGLQYFVMKFVRGRPLDSVVHSAGALPLAMVQTILSQAGSALAYAHKNGVVHRDVKPANIMLDEDGWAVVADFGIAKVARADKLTATGMIVGTAAYMSPEQWAGQDVSGLSDEYSLGIVAYELLTGKPPFTGETVPALLWSHLNEMPAPIATKRPDCPEELSRIVMRMIEKDPAARWPTLDDAVAAITALPMPESLEETRTQLMSLATAGMDSGRISGAGSSGAPVMPSSRVARLALSPASAEVSVSASMRVQVRALNDTGQQLARRAVSWRSGDIAIATVDADGVVSARGPGKTLIYATCEGVEISMPVVVSGERVAPRRNRRRVWIATSIAAAVVIAIGAKSFWRPSPHAPSVADTTGKGAANVKSAPDTSKTPEQTAALNASRKPDPPSRGAAGKADTGKKAAAPATSSAPVNQATQQKADSIAIRNAAGSGATTSGTGAPPPVAPSGPPAAGTGGGAAETRTAPVNDHAGAPPASSPAPVEPPGPMFKEISAGGASTCAAMTNNVDVLCWGADALVGTVVSGFYFTKLSVGSSHACGITAEGVAYCWGENGSGQLGDNTTTTRKSPTKVQTTVAFTSISVGGSHTCALAQDGTGWCWGSNRNGQLGDGSLNTRKKPNQVKSGETFQSLSAGNAHTCGVRGNKPYCWGAGFAGQVGNKMQQDEREPFPIATPLKFNNVVTGGDHTCALASGHAYCWGDNKEGDLGNDTKDDRNSPDSVATDLIFRQLSAGASHTCGVTTDARIACWGQNVSGQLGTGTRAASQIPVLISTKGVTWKQVSAGNAHTCAISRTDLVYCWGANLQGQLGSGAAGGNQPVPTPIRVSLPGK